MKLTFPKFSECISALELLDASLPSSSSPATCLLVKNIRSFKDWSVVPLSRLNVLTGPNSSGKSTVAELLALFNDEFSQARLDALAPGPSFIGFSVDWNAFVTTGLDRIRFGGQQHIFENSFMWDLSRKFEKARVRGPQKTHPRRLTYILETAGGQTSASKKLTIYLYGDAECLGALGDFSDDSFEEEAQHFRVAPKLFRHLFVDKTCVEIEENLGCLRWWKKPALGSKNLPDSFNRKLKEYWIPIVSSGDRFDLSDGPCVGMDKNWDSPDMVGCVQSVLWVLFYSPVWLLEKYASKILPAVRPVSSPEQLTYRFKEHAPYPEQPNENADQAFADLAERLAGDVKRRLRRRTKKPGQQGVDRVNAFLHTTLGSSHQLSSRVHVSRGKGKEIYETVVELFLQGPDSVDLSLADVGTGVSQVLPVIAAGAVTSYGSDSIGIYRQPELHLHPRAQSGLGDFFIERMNADPGAALTLETHSEHLILRLLRRLRERLPRRSPLHLRPSDLSLIYLHPTKSGSEVHLIRVDDNGDFIDPWPAGFFEDRYEDLFFEPK